MEWVNKGMNAKNKVTKEEVKVLKYHDQRSIWTLKERREIKRDQ